MKKLKDLIYDTNDIIIALLILAVAALIIVWRMNVIMDYPKALLGTEDYDSPIATDTVMPSDVTDSTVVDETDSDIVLPDLTEEDLEDAPVQVWNEDERLTARIVVDIEGNSAVAAVQCLIDAGLFHDYDEYMSTCEDANLDPEKIAAGRFTFELGSTKEDIVKQINWG